MLLPALGAWAPRRPSVRRLSESSISDDCICSPSHVSAGQWLTLDFSHEVVEMSGGITAIGCGFSPEVSVLHQP